MAALGKIGSESRMATPWRRRRMCILHAPSPAPAALRRISGSGAFLETNSRPELGATVELHHPDAGAIFGTVCGLSSDGVEIGFLCGEDSVGFALAAIAADMSRPTR